MTVTSFLKNFLFGSQYVGIEHFSYDTEEKVALLEFKKSKQELVIAKQDLRIFKDSILKSFDKKKAHLLVVNTNQVIQKEVEEDERSDNKLLHKAFPNIKWEDFYYEIWRLKNKSIVCISRKSYIDELLLKYQKEGVSVTHISLGNCSVSSIMNFSTYETLETNKHSLNISDSDLTISLRDKQKLIRYDINGLTVSNEHLLPFSAVIQYFVNKKSTSGNVSNLNSNLEDHYFQKQFFRKGIQLGVCFLLTTLLINFFIFTNYYKKVQENDQILIQNSSSKKAFSKTKERIVQKEEKLNAIYSTKQTQCTYLINEITKSVHSSILLTELMYQPLEKKIKSGEAILIQNNVIIISGTTINNQQFTNWTESLQKFKSIDKVIITHFGSNETSETAFSLKIVLHEIK